MGIPVNPGDFRTLTPYGDLSLPLHKYAAGNSSLKILEILSQDPFVLKALIQNSFLNIIFTPDLWRYKLILFLDFHKYLIEKKQDFEKKLENHDQFIIWNTYIFIENCQNCFDSFFDFSFLFYKNNVFQYLTAKQDLAMIATLALWVWDQSADYPQDKVSKVLVSYTQLRYTPTAPGIILRFLDPLCLESSHAKVLLLTAIDLTLRQLTKERYYE